MRFHDNLPGQNPSPLLQGGCLAATGPLLQAAREIGGNPHCDLPQEDLDEANFESQVRCRRSLFFCFTPHYRARL